VPVPPGATRHATVTAQPVDCPAGSGHALSVGAPPQLAFGRRWRMAVTVNPRRGLKFSTVTLSMRLRKSAPPFRTERIGVRQFGVAQLVNRPITLHRGDGPTIVSIAYRQQTRPGAATAWIGARS
jgi:hypothetical protein